jgi:hypothetical protein
MFDRYKCIYMTGKAEKNTEAHKDPNVFPPATLFAMRKKIEIPKIAEGFTNVITVEAPSIKWDGRKYRNKAVFFDIDGTLRHTEHLKHKYPIIPEEVEPMKIISLKEQKEKLKLSNTRERIKSPSLAFASGFSYPSLNLQEMW